MQTLISCYRYCIKEINTVGRYVHLELHILFRQIYVLVILGFMPMHITMLWLLCILYCITDSVLSSSLCSRYVDVLFINLRYPTLKWRYLFIPAILPLAYRESRVVRAHIGTEKNRHVKVKCVSSCSLFKFCIRCWANS